MSGKTKQLFLAALFGLAFGFFIQKGGVAKYHLLVGVLLLEEFAVIKVMVSAIIVGMIGIFFLHSRGRVELKIKPTRLGAITIGGLLFGAGFGLSGYCPGTAAAAVGQGNYDALCSMLGLVVGSYVFAWNSEWLNRTINRWGDKGTLLIPDVLGLPRWPFIAIFCLILAGALAALEVLAP